MLPLCPQSLTDLRCALLPALGKGEGGAGGPAAAAAAAWLVRPRSSSSIPSHPPARLSARAALRDRASCREARQPVGVHTNRPTSKAAGARR